MSLRRLTSRFVERVWGSDSLAPFFSSQPERIGEVWFEDAPGAPLLIKFLFTTEKLSVQVHPADEYALTHEQSRGKTEMWHILNAAPGATLAVGLRREVDPAEFVEAAKSGAILDLLAWREAKTGQTFFIPAGTVHVIGEGFTICEIQQNSDVTYRLYDYGRGRELHLERGAAVSHLGPSLEEAPLSGEVIAECAQFQVSRWVVAETRVVRPRSGCREYWVAIDGAGSLEGQAFRAGDVFVNEGQTEAFEIRGPVTLLYAASSNPD